MYFSTKLSILVHIFPLDQRKLFNAKTCVCAALLASIPKFTFCVSRSLYLFQTRTFSVSLSITLTLSHTLTFLRLSHTLFQTQTQTYSHAHFCVTIRQVLLLRLKHRLARGRKNVAALTPRNARSKLDRSITTIHLPFHATKRGRLLRVYKKV